MTQIVIDLPEQLARLPERERSALLRAGVHEAIRGRIKEVESEIGAARAMVARFEDQYGVDLAGFEGTILQSSDSPETHEEYNDWVYWQAVLTSKQSLLDELTGDDRPPT